MTIFKRTILFLHRWLGIITGLVVFVVSITGCIFCFQDEIQDALYSYRKVEVQNKPYLLPSVFKHKAEYIFPHSTNNYIYYYGANRPVGMYVNTKKEDLLMVYFNPYTGRHLYTEVSAKNFFVIVEYIHLYLLLPPNIGKMVVGISVLIFVAIMITGIILWWPKRKSDHKRSFTIKWNGRWRRINYDLHNVLGFYATGIAIVLAITGVSMSFEWVRKGIYSAGNLGKSYAVETIYPKSNPLNRSKAVNYPVIDKAFLYAEQHSLNAQMFLISDDQSAGGTVGITAYPESMHFDRNDNYDFDRYTGKPLRMLPNVKKSPGLKLNDMNYDIHVGQVLGLTGKILAFLASLICASLPVTGFIIWLGKRKKKPKAQKVHHVIERRSKHPYQPAKKFQADV